MAWDSGARPVILLSKADLSSAVSSERAEVAIVAPGVEVIAASVRTGMVSTQCVGSAARRHRCAGRPVWHRQVQPRQCTCRYGTVWQQAPRATTGRAGTPSTTRELVPLPWGAVLLDTPGLRGVQLWDSAEGVEQTFSDVEISRCRVPLHRLRP